MKIVSFEAGGTESFGVVRGDGVVKAGPKTEFGATSVREVLESGRLSELEAFTGGKSADFGLDEIVYLQPIPDPDMIICVGMNYGSAFEEVGQAFPGYPSLFMRRTSAQVGHNQPIKKPASSEKFDCEAELAVIIGVGGSEIPVARAADHIAGYSIFNDASAVDWMAHTKQNVTPGKNFDGSGAFGPWMVTAGELRDVPSLTVRHVLNGEEIQSGPVSDMCYGIDQLINYVSTFTTLRPGDVISTGSPGGIRSRRQADKWVRPGDVIEMSVDGIGTLRNPVA